MVLLGIYLITGTASGGFESGPVDQMKTVFGESFTRKYYDKIRSEYNAINKSSIIDSRFLTCMGQFLGSAALICCQIWFASIVMACYWYLKDRAKYG